MKKLSKREMADEAWNRTVQGQVDAFEGVQGEEPPPEARTVATEFPRECPGCHRPADRPCFWTHLRSGPMLQCGQCGHLVAVTTEAWKEVREDARRAFRDKATGRRTA